MRSAVAAVFAVIVIMGGMACAEEAKQEPSAQTQAPAGAGAEGSKKPKSVEVPLDVATDLIKKTNAFFQGNLEVTMSSGRDRYKNKNSYTVNAIGQKVPKATTK